MNRMIRRCFVSIMMTVVLSAAASGGTVYVNATAAGEGDGSSWADAFTQLAPALAAAAPGDEVWVAMSTYPVPNSLGFVGPQGVSLYGGFVGDETSIEQRPPTNRTRLTGFHPVRGVIVLTLNNPTPGTVLDGFLFDGTLTIDHDGGGLAVHGGTVEVVNCTFIDNIAGSGAGAYVSNCHATFTGCTFDNNFCQVGDGGGIEAVGVGSLTVKHCRFVDNLARELFGVLGRGGGIFNDAGSVLRVHDCVFERNRAYNLGQQLVSTGGGVANLSPDARIDNCVFVRNDATLGGAIASEAPILINNCLIAANRATEPGPTTPFESGQGGAIYGPEGVDLTVKNCTIVGNWSKHTAGGLWMDGVVENTILFHNVSLVEPGDNPEPIADQQSQGSIEFRSCNVQGLSVPDAEHPRTISADPRFLALPVLSSPTAFYPTYTPGDLHLLPNSPCIDAGDNAAVVPGTLTDVSGQPRFYDDPGAPNVGVGTPPHVDLGAYERSPIACLPSIDTQPATMTICPSAIAGFSVVAVGTGPFTYQWQRENTPGSDAWTNLGNGLTSGLGIINGVTTPTLSISDFGPLAPANYRCIVTNGCGGAPTDPAALAVIPPGCAGDADADGFVGLSDIAALVTRWGSPAPSTAPCIDFDGSRVIGLGDIAAVVNRWGTTCP